MTKKGHKERFYCLLLLGSLLTITTVSCESGSTTSRKPPSPDRVHVQRVCTLTQTQCTPFETNVTDPTKTQQLYQAMQALPKIPADAVIHCPPDNGIKYHLDFFQGSTPLPQATLDASGCRMLHLTTTDVRQTNDTFWSLLTTITGIPNSA